MLSHAADPTGPVFISYRWSDGADLAIDAARRLRASGVPVWLDRDDLPPVRRARASKMTRRLALLRRRAPSTTLTVDLQTRVARPTCLPAGGRGRFQADPNSAGITSPPRALPYSRRESRARRLLASATNWPVGFPSAGEGAARVFEQEPDLDVVVLGGGGHVGLPLSLSLAEAGLRVGIYDTNQATLDMIADGRMSFLENGADELLGTVLATGRLTLSSSGEILSRTRQLVVVVGTPVDEFLAPTMTAFEKTVDQIAPYIRSDSLLVAESDDIRASLSYKLRKLLTWAGADVLCTDPFVPDDRPVVDVWGALGAGIVL